MIKIIICKGNKIHDLDYDVIRHWNHLNYLNFIQLIRLNFIPRFIEIKCVHAFNYGLNSTCLFLMEV